MIYYPHKGAGDVRVAASLMAVSGLAIAAEAYHLVPFSNLYLIPAGYVALRAFLHMAISSAVREGYLLAAQDISGMNDVFDAGSEPAEPIEEAGMKVLDPETFRARAENGVAN